MSGQFAAGLTPSLVPRLLRESLGTRLGVKPAWERGYQLWCSTCSYTMSACPLHGYIPMRTLYMGTFPCIPPKRAHSHAYPLHGYIPMHTPYTGTFPCIPSTRAHSHAYPLHGYIPMHILYTCTFPCIHAYPLHGYIPMHILYTCTFPCISSTRAHSHAMCILPTSSQTKPLERSRQPVRRAAMCCW